MTTTHKQTNPIVSLLGAGAIFAGGYFGYNAFFPSDRSQVRSCISAMLEASRGQVGYGEMRSKMQAVDVADTIVITDETRRDFGNSTMVTFEYLVDGRASRTVCSQ